MSVPATYRPLKAVVLAAGHDQATRDLLLRPLAGSTVIEQTLANVEQPQAVAVGPDLSCRVEVDSARFGDLNGLRRLARHAQRRREHRCGEHRDPLHYSDSAELSRTHTLAARCSARVSPSSATGSPFAEAGRITKQLDSL